MESGALVASALTCTVCRGVFDNPVAISKGCDEPCHHAFCSTCIRTWLRDHTSCPECKRPNVSQSHLVPCRALNAVALAFKGQAAPPPLDVPLKRLPIIHYSSLSDAQLEHELKTHGLEPLDGGREANMVLHREFMLLYNAAMDGGVAPVFDDMRKEARKRARDLLKDPKAPDGAITFGRKRDAVEQPHDAAVPLVVARAIKKARASEKAKWAGAPVEPGSFRAVWSDKLNAPVYWNCVTGECTLTRPPEREFEVIALDDDDDVDANETEQGHIVIVKKS